MDGKTVKIRIIKQNLKLRGVSYTCSKVDEVVENAIRVIFTKLNNCPEKSIMQALRNQVDNAKQLEQAQAELMEAEKISEALRKELVKSLIGSSLLAQEDIDIELQKSKVIMEGLRDKINILQNTVKVLIEP